MNNASIYASKRLWLNVPYLNTFWSHVVNFSYLVYGFFLYYNHWRYFTCFLFPIWQHYAIITAVAETLALKLKLCERQQNALKWQQQQQQNKTTNKSTSMNFHSKIHAATRLGLMQQNYENYKLRQHHHNRQKSKDCAFQLL